MAPPFSHSLNIILFPLRGNVTICIFIVITEKFIFLLKILLLKNQVWENGRNINGNIGSWSKFSMIIKIWCVPGLASSDGRTCALEIFASTESGLNPASAGIFSRGIEIYSIKTWPRIFEKCDGIWTRLNDRKSKHLYSMGERRKIWIYRTLQASSK